MRSSSKTVRNLIEEINKALFLKGAPPNMIKDEFCIMTAWSNARMEEDAAIPQRFFVIFQRDKSTSEISNLLIGELDRYNPATVGFTPDVIGFSKVFTVVKPTEEGVYLNSNKGDFSWNSADENMFMSSPGAKQTYGVLPIDTTNPVVLEYLKDKNSDDAGFEPWRFDISSINPGTNQYQCNILGGSRYKRRPKKKTRRVKTKKNKKRKSLGKKK